MAKISIVIPIYNNSSTLLNCVNSVRNQALSDIEIICVDDGSTDNSLEILNRMVEKDSRVKILTLERNKGTGYARKIGVQETTGKYVMFLDADDTLELNACGVLWEIAEKEKMDIIHFMPIVNNVIDLPDDSIQKVKKFLKPFNGYLYNESILKECFLTQSYSHHLWNKIFEGKVCRKSFRTFPDEYLIASEDFLAYFFLSYYADSYLGISIKGFYNYNYGFGICGAAEREISIEHFLKLSDIRVIYNHLWNFIMESHTMAIYKKTLVQIKHSLIKSSFTYSQKLKNPKEVNSLLSKYWERKDLRGFKRKEYWMNFKKRVKEFLNLQ